MKKHKKLTITLIVLAVLIITSFIATLPLYTTNSNVDKYTGAKLEAARRAIDFDKDFDSPSVALPFMPSKVESIQPNTEAPCNSDPNNAAYYAVTVSRVWLFGMTYQSNTYLLCRMG
jgi:hypothetical protein